MEDWGYESADPILPIFHSSIPPGQKPFAPGARASARTAPRPTEHPTRLPIPNRATKNVLDAGG
jgi:hypothetical protein